MSQTGRCKAPKAVVLVTKVNKSGGGRGGHVGLGGGVTVGSATDTSLFRSTGGGEGDVAGVGRVWYLHQLPVLSFRLS